MPVSMPVETSSVSVVSSMVSSVVTSMPVEASPPVVMGHGRSFYVTDTKEHEQG